MQKDSDTYIIENFCLSKFVGKLCVFFVGNIIIEPLKGGILKLLAGIYHASHSYSDIFISVSHFLPYGNIYIETLD